MKARQFSISFGCAISPLFVLALSGCGSFPQNNLTNGTLVDAWVTTGDKTRLLAKESPLAFAMRAPLKTNIEIDDGKRFQTMVGFGASITDASAWLIKNRMAEAQRTALLEELFGRGPNGIGFDFTRLTIVASDFSRDHYTFNDRPVGETDMPRESVATFVWKPAR